MPKRKASSGKPTRPLKAQNRFGGANIRTTEELIALAKNDRNRTSSGIERSILGIGNKPKRKKTDKEKAKDSASRRKYLTQIKSIKALENKVDQPLIDLWEKRNPGEYRGKDHFYLVAVDQLKVSKHLIRIRFEVLEKAGLIKVETTSAPPNPLVAANLVKISKISLNATQRAIILKSPFSVMTTEQVLTESKRIFQQRPKDAKRLLIEASLIYQAKVGRTFTEFLQEIQP
jgi:hypothetical protein